MVRQDPAGPSRPTIAASKFFYSARGRRGDRKTSSRPIARANRRARRRAGRPLGCPSVRTPPWHCLGVLQTDPRGSTLGSSGISGGRKPDPQPGYGSRGREQQLQNLEAGATVKRNRDPSRAQITARAWAGPGVVNFLRSAIRACRPFGASGISSLARTRPAIAWQRQSHPKLTLAFWRRPVSMPHSRILDTTDTGQAGHPCGLGMAMSNRTSQRPLTPTVGPRRRGVCRPVWARYASD
jgi:hypothetical protein